MRMNVKYCKLTCMAFLFIFCIFTEEYFKQKRNGSNFNIEGELKSDKVKLVQA